MRLLLLVGLVLLEQALQLQLAMGADAPADAHAPPLAAGHELNYNVEASSSYHDRPAHWRPRPVRRSSSPSWAASPAADNDVRVKLKNDDAGAAVVLELDSDDPSAHAAAALALRVLGPRAPGLFSFATLPPGSCEVGGPCAVVEDATATPDATVRISGSSAVEMAFGLAHYCRTKLNMTFSWNNTGGNQVRLPRVLPRGLGAAKPVKLQKHCAPSQGGRCFTYYANVCTLTYSMWSWDWARC